MKTIIRNFTSFPPALVLKGSFGLSPKGRVLRTSLICLQFVVSFMLVICVGIMYLQSWKNANENPVNSIKTE